MVFQYSGLNRIILKEELSLFTDYQITYVKNSMETTKNLWELISSVREIYKNEFYFYTVAMNNLKIKFQKQLY